MPKNLFSLNLPRADGSCCCWWAGVVVVIAAEVPKPRVGVMLCRERAVEESRWVKIKIWCGILYYLFQDDVQMPDLPSIARSESSPSEFSKSMEEELARLTASWACVASEIIDPRPEDEEYRDGGFWKTIQLLRDVPFANSTKFTGKREQWLFPPPVLSLEM